MSDLTIEGIRKLAELNLPSECYEKYLHIIEPNIRSLIPNYLKDWQNVEAYVTMTVMRHMGIFKTSIAFLSIDDDVEEKYGDKLDVNKFREVKKWWFKQKIDYLLKEGILGENSHKFLDILREKRNKIHEMGAVFSEKELREFSMAYSIVFYLCTAEATNNVEETERQTIRHSIERWAEEALKFVNTK